MKRLSGEYGYINALNGNVNTRTANAPSKIALATNIATALRLHT